MHAENPHAMIEPRVSAIIPVFLQGDPIPEKALNEMIQEYKKKYPRRDASTSLGELMEVLE